MKRISAEEIKTWEDDNKEPEGREREIVLWTMINIRKLAEELPVQEAVGRIFAKLVGVEAESTEEEIATSCFIIGECVMKLVDKMKEELFSEEALQYLEKSFKEFCENYDKNKKKNDEFLEEFQQELEELRKE